MRFFKRISLNRKPILQYTMSVLSIASMALGAMFSLPDSVKENYPLRIMLVLIAMVVATISASIYVIFFRHQNTLWEKGKASVSVIYGDLIKISFRGNALKRIVVIHVNTTFDTEVDEAGTVDKPLVSPGTLHGIWLNECMKHEVSIDEINQKIDNALKNVQPERLLKDKKRGKKKDYPIGTVAPISFVGMPVTFLLVALSRFDEDNNAHASSDDLSKSIRNVINFCDKSGQGVDVYLPLMGTGSSRMDLSDEDALLQMKAGVLSNLSKIHQKFFIVVYEKNKDKVSIF